MISEREASWLRHVTFVCVCFDGAQFFQGEGVVVVANAMEPRTGHREEGVDNIEQWRLRHTAGHAAAVIIDKAQK